MEETWSEADIREVRAIENLQRRVNYLVSALSPRLKQLWVQRQAEASDLSDQLDAFVNDQSSRSLPWRRVEMDILCSFPPVFLPAEDGFVVVKHPILPGVVTQGRTVEEALQNMREAVEASDDEGDHDKT